MPTELDVESTTLAHRVVLLGVAELAARDETPAHAGEIRATCTDAMADVEGDVLGRLAEADVSRSLNELEAEEFLAATQDDTSPTGKGRPRYELAVERPSLLDALADDDRVAALVDRLER